MAVNVPADTGGPPDGARMESEPAGARSLVEGPRSGLLAGTTVEATAALLIHGPRNRLIGPELSAAAVDIVLGADSYGEHARSRSLWPPSEAG